MRGFLGALFAIGLAFAAIGEAGADDDMTADGYLNETELTDMILRLHPRLTFASSFIGIARTCNARDTFWQLYAEEAVTFFAMQPEYERGTRGWGASKALRFIKDSLHEGEAATGEHLKSEGSTKIWCAKLAREPRFIALEATIRAFMLLKHHTLEMPWEP